MSALVCPDCGSRDLREIGEHDVGGYWRTYKCASCATYHDVWREHPGPLPRDAVGDVVACYSEE